ncbi:hypothetical protein VRB09_25035 [Pseudomonas poae]|uniref:hypothetical protein n=1 Tax=Pseudomonas poae TaxID=200451 RepID=UPI0030D2F115
MLIGITSDAPGWSKVSEISKELRSLGSLAEKKYPSLEWQLVICLRCLPKELERKTFCRYYAKDKMFGLDITMDEEDFIPLKKDKAAQRKLIGAAFIAFFIESIKKYKNKLPNLQPVSAQLIEDVQQWCIENEWTA